MEKKRFFANHSKSSALVVSVAIHAILIVVAISFVAVKVIIKPEPDFVATKVKRPKMPPKKLQVPVDVKKRTPKPRLRKHIVSHQKTFADIKIPEITGVKGGFGNMGGDGLGSMGGDGLGSLGFGMDIGDLFGGNKSMGGNELTGTFYDLKQTKKGEPTNIDTGKYDAVIQRFLRSWNERIFRDYFSAPKKKYATAFMMPTMRADVAPESFGVANEVKPKLWLAHYTGLISAPKTGRYRFCGQGDDILYVRVKNRLVLDASWPNVQGRLSGWTSDDGDNRKFQLGNNKMVIGDWINLTEGKPVKIEILLGERPGGLFCCQLVIEEKGKVYRQAPYTYEEGDETQTGTRPVLPVFKLTDIPKELQQQMKVVPDEATFDGSNFGIIKK